MNRSRLEFDSVRVAYRGSLVGLARKGKIQANTNANYNPVAEAEAILAEAPALV